MTSMYYIESGSSTPSSRWNWNLEMLIGFSWKEKKENLSGLTATGKDDRELTTNSNHIRRQFRDSKPWATIPRASRRKLSLLPLGHPCSLTQEVSFRISTKTKPLLEKRLFTLKPLTKNTYAHYCSLSLENYLAYTVTQRKNYRGECHVWIIQGTV